MNKNFEFLVTKTSNTFTSSDITFKSKFLDNIQMLIKEKEN